jgi:DNA-binding transcriptional LysR family regulator
MSIKPTRQMLPKEVRNMDIRQLEYFIEVARHKSFSKAADSVYVSQPSISRAIRELENELGVALLYRNTKSVELTDNGEAILEQAQQIISSFQNIAAQLEEVAKLQTGKIHIGLPPITGVTVLADLLGKFKKEYPNIEISLYEFGSKKIELAIQEGLLDVGVICVPPEDNGLYEMISLVKDPLWIIMHPGHRLASRSDISYCDLIDERFVLYSNDFGLHDTITERCRQAGLNPHILLKTSQRELMTQIVAAGLGVAFLPSKICQALDPKRIISLPMVDAQFYLQLAIAWKKNRYLSHAARKMLEFTKKSLADIE